MDDDNDDDKDDFDSNLASGFDNTLLAWRAFLANVSSFSSMNTSRSIDSGVLYSTRHASKMDP